MMPRKPPAFSTEDVPDDLLGKEDYAERKAAVQDKMDEPTVMRVLTTPDSVNGKTLFEAFMELPREQRFAVGDGVEKIMGYRWPGEVRSVFLNKAAQIRYVVECIIPDVEGALHIYSPNQIKTRITTR